MSVFPLKVRLEVVSACLKYTCRFYIMGKVTVLNYANSRS